MNNRLPIYLDNAATTIPFEDVLNTYNKVAVDFFGNSSSVHKLGADSLNLFNKAQDQILNVLKLKDHEVIFTSGATESINLGIKGFCFKNQNRGRHIITTVYEHPAVLESVKQLEEYFGFSVTYLKPNDNGIISVNSVKESLTNDTILVAIMAVNNEIGSINDIAKIGELLKEYPKLAFFVDATQSIGKVNIDYSSADMLCFSGHKIHGCKGTGCLIKKKSISLLPMNSGGGQQNNLRSGTIDLAGATSLAKALRISCENLNSNLLKVKQLQQKLLSYLKENNNIFEINSFESNPYIVNFSTLEHKASVVVEGLSNENIYVSTISACHSSKEVGSYVVMAVKNDEKLASNTIRVSFSAENTLDEINALIEALDRIIRGIKQ